LIYLDYNRTTPVAPAVLEAMQPFWSTHFLLPSQDHAQAQAVGEALESAREGVAGLLGCDPFEIVFTSGGTEANNLGICGLAGNLTPGHLLLGPIEHDSVSEAAHSLAEDGWEIETMPGDASGTVDPERLAGQLRDQTRLVCLQLANPVIGTIQPVRQVADLCHNRGVLLHCDASQAPGKIPLVASQLRADTLAISGHKFFAPKGSGALYIRRGLNVRRINFGQPREMGLRAGAENVPACVGLGAAAILAAKYAEEAPTGLAELRDRFLNGVEDNINPTPECIALDSLRLPNTVALELPGEARRLLKSARELAVSTSASGVPPDEMARVVAAGEEILRVCVESGGVISGEHGIGTEKREYMGLVFTEADLDAMERLRRAFDPDLVCNPGKIFPTTRFCMEANPKARGYDRVPFE